MANSSQSNQAQINLQGQIALLEAQITLTNSGIDSKTETGQTLRNIIHANDLSSLRAKISDAEKYSKTLADDIGELEKWAKIASDVSKNPEETPFKLMNKALGKSFSNFSYEKEVLSLEREINSWFNSLQDKNSKALATFLVGSEKPFLIAEAFPQFFNEFQYQGDQSKLIDTWYSRESWQGVSDAYYQEVAWRKSVLSEIQSKILLLNWQVATKSISPNQDLPNQPDINYLKDLQAKLEKQKANTQEKLTSYDNFYQKYYQDFLQRGLLEEEAENLANEWAGALVLAQKDEAENETSAKIQIYNASDSQLRGFNPDTSHIGNRPISNRNQGQQKTREGQAFMGRAEKNRGTYINPAVRGLRQILGQIFRQSAQSTEQSEQASQNRVQNAPGQAVGAATGIVGAVATTGIKAAINKGVQGLLAKAGAVAGPVGLVVSQAVSVLFDKETRQRFINFIKNILTRAGLGLYVLYQYLASHMLASATGVLGAIFLGPIGFIPGFAVGLGIESAFGIGGIVGTGMASSGTAVAAAGSSGGILAATWFSPAAAISVGGFGALFTAAFLVPSAFFQTPEVSEAYEAPMFTVTKEIVSVNGAPVVNNEIANIGANSAEIIYKITFNSEGETITLGTPTDKATSYKSGRDPAEISPSPEPIAGQAYPTSLAPGESKSVEVATTITGGPEAIYDNSRLVNTITATGTVKEEGKEPVSQIQTAMVSLKIGNPVDGPPYGFPIAGKVKSLDYDVISGGGCKGKNGKPDHTHCGEFSPGEVIFGGVDISALGEVRSTITGRVEISSFDNKVGGNVVILSESGEYRVLFLHLKDPRKEIKAGDEISMGQRIGEIYPDKLVNTSGAHIHYQVLKDSQNLPFATAPAGECSTTGDNIMTLIQKGVIENRVKNHTEPTISSGPFECN